MRGAFQKFARWLVGPASATDGNLVVFDGTSGMKTKDGGALPSPFTNGAGADVVPVSDGTNLVGSGTDVTLGGSNSISATAPTVTNTGSTSIKNISPLFGAGRDGLNFQIGDNHGTTAGEIITYGGVAPTNGQLLIGDTGNGKLVIGSLSSGSVGISVASGAGSISVSLDGATPLSWYLAGDYTNATASFTNTAISVTLASSTKYSFITQIFVANSTAADGFGIDFNGGTATATNFIAGSSTSLVTGTSTSLAGVFSNGTLTGTNLLTISGSIEVNAGGTFIIRAKESAHTTGTLTVLKGSSLILTKMQ